MAWSTPQGPAFEREHGLTEREWLQQLPGAVGAHALQLADGAAQVTIGGGALQLRWHALPPRQIALMRMPRLHVAYQFTGVPDDDRARFLRYFDLFMQKGGG
jgi:hypothetical protein